MPWGVAAAAAISAGAGAAGSAGQKGAASEAAGAQSAGIQQGIDALGGSYGKAQGYLDPYYKTGRQVDRKLAQRYGIIPEGLTKKQRKAYKKSRQFKDYEKSLAAINASAPSAALPDLSRFDISGLDEKYDPSGIINKYDPSGITNKYSGLSSKYDTSGIVNKYDVANLGDRVNVEQDPGYQFRKMQGEQAQKRMASARGTLQGGGFAKDLEEFSQGLASQEYGNAYARLFGENQTGFGREMDANQMGYGREIDTYGREIQGNELGYGREMQGNELGYGRELQTNDIGYGRALNENEITYGRGQNDYARQLQMLGLKYEPLQRMSDRGFQTAGGLSDLASNYGGNIANLFSQQGQAKAGGIQGRAAAQAQMFNQLGQIGSIGALYAGQGFGSGTGGQQGMPNNYARYSRGGYNPYATGYYGNQGNF